jgi:hypothetical protein
MPTWKVLEHGTSMPPCSAQGLNQVAAGTSLWYDAAPNVQVSTRLVQPSAKHQWHRASLECSASNSSQNSNGVKPIVAFCGSSSV